MSGPMSDAKHKGGEGGVRQTGRTLAIDTEPKMNTILKVIHLIDIHPYTAQRNTTDFASPQR